MARQNKIENKNPLVLDTTGVGKNWQRYPKILEALKIAQELNSHTLGPDEVHHSLDQTGLPAVLYHDTDQHWGAEGADFGHTLEIVEWVKSRKNHFILSTGDELDWEKGDYKHTIRGALDTQTQEDSFGFYYIEPLLPFLLGMVGYYDSHPGWDLVAGNDPWSRWRQRFGVQTLLQGGRINLKIDKGPNFVFELRHNPGGSKKDNPLLGLRDHASAWDDSDPEKPDLYLAGHVHRKAVSQEIIRRGSKIITLSQGGTEKGNNPKRIDRHGAITGRDLADPPGNSFVLNLRKSKNEIKKVVYISPTRRRADKARDAFEYLNRAEQLRATTDLEGQIINKVEKNPSVKFDRTQSLALSEGRGVEIAHDGTILSPIYDRAHWNISSKLPIRIIFAANLRWGSASARENTGNFRREILNPAINDPYTLVVGLRHWVDTDIASDENRQEILDQLIKVFSPLTETNQLLTIMLSKSLRHKAWKKPVGEADYQQPLSPGSYLSKGLKGTPLIQNQSQVWLNFNRSPKNTRQIKIATIDGIMGSSASANPVMGLRRRYGWGGIRTDIVVGGTGGKAAIEFNYDRHNLQTHHPLFIATGWEADVDTWGKANTQIGAPGGQSITVCSDNDVYPALTSEDGIDLQKALWLFEGSKLLGVNLKKL